jgi:hypothetical protein
MPSTTDISGETRASRFLPVLLPLIVFCAVSSWRPFRLGFYHDDWVTVARLPVASLGHEFIDQISRPLYFLLLALFRTLVPPSPAGWQDLIALLTAASAATIGLLIRRMALLISDNEATARWSGAIAAATWIACPWTLGVSSWPTTFAAPVSVIGFCLIGLIWLSDRPFWKKLTIGLALFISISLISEAFWGAFIPLLIITAGLNYTREGTARPREVFFLFLGFGFVQSIFAFSNRIIAWFGIGYHRSFNAEWISTSLASFQFLPSEIDRTVLWPALFWVLAAIVILTSLAALFLHPRRWLVGSIILAIVCGSVGSIVLFALASYRMEMSGLFSRTAFVFSFWVILLPAIAFAVAASISRITNGIALAVCILLIALFSVSSIAGSQDWIAAWRQEQDVLHSFPGNALAIDAKIDSFVVVIAPRPPGTIPGLNAFWDISGALLTTYPKLAGAFSPEGFRFFATMANPATQSTEWDGKEITQSWCTPPHAKLWQLAAPTDLYVWQYGSRTLSHFTRPVTFGCGVDIPAS